MNKLMVLAGLLSAIAATGASGQCPDGAAATGQLLTIERKLERTLNDDFNRDPLSVMRYYNAASIQLYDVMPGDEHGGIEVSPRSLPDHLKQIAPQFIGKLHFFDLRAHACGDVGFVSMVQHFAGKGADGRPLELTIRATDGFEKSAGSWKIVHEHLSFPTDMASGKATTDARF